MEGLVDGEGRIVDPYRNFIHISRYARWLDEENRRETWAETVDRYVNFMVDHLMSNNSYVPPTEDVEKVRTFILNHWSLPSMRAMMTAGPALERQNVAGYNCSYLPIDSVESFDETLYILMNGSGVGFSAESMYTSKLPTIPQQFKPGATVYVEDSKEGWAYALREIIRSLYHGEIPTWDTSDVRPAGSRLMVFGGRASGPEPLEKLFRFVISKFQMAGGRQLKPIEVHSIICMIASVVVVGGVRRAALISLGDLDDGDFVYAKHGEWWNQHPEYGLANNSAVYDFKPTKARFNQEWDALVASGSGERGIYNREASRKQAARYGRRSSDIEYGVNPCSEIILRPYQFCNLSTVVVESEDNLDDLENKVEVATILGTWQSTLTNFTYLRDVWKGNTEEERLLGVSMTGVFGNRLLNGKVSYNTTAQILEHLRELAVRTNKRLANHIGINQAAAVTCIKPEGTTSQMTLTSSGLHPWYDRQYVRTVRGDKKDPLTRFLIDAGFPYEDELMNPDDTVVFSFPVQAPEDAIVREDISAIEHLELWLMYQRHWCEHKPSVTINVKPEEWASVGEWVYEHFDEISGVSFLPYSEHTYKQAPYQSVSQQEYSELTYAIPYSVPWHLLSVYETEDATTGSQELSCSASGGCEVVDIG